jgi:hypothetical protein
MARGAKQKYGEVTVTMNVRVPKSKLPIIKTLVKNELEKYKTNNSRGEAEGSKSENSGED